MLSEIHLSKSIDEEKVNGRRREGNKKRSLHVEKTGRRGLFPEICMIFKRKVSKVKVIRQSLSKIVTEAG